MRISRSRQASCAACAAAARGLHCFAALFALAFERRAPRIERIERHQAAIEFGARARQRVLAEAELARDFRGLLFEALAAQRGFLRRARARLRAGRAGRHVRDARPGCGSAPRRARAPPVASSSRQVARRASMSRVFSSLRGELDAQLLDALLALEHARVRIAAAIDAQPVAADPLARTRDDGFVAGELAAQLQRFGQRFRQAHARQQPHDGGGSADHARQHAGVAVGFHVPAAPAAARRGRRAATAARPATASSSSTHSASR